MYIESLFPKVMLVCVHLFSDTFLGARGDGEEDKGTPHQHQGDDYAATFENTCILDSP